jgi:hypothetical protein
MNLITEPCQLNNNNSSNGNDEYTHSLFQIIR